MKGGVWIPVTAPPPPSTSYAAGQKEGRKEFSMLVIIKEFISRS